MPPIIDPDEGELGAIRGMPSRSADDVAPLGSRGRRSGRIRALGCSRRRRPLRSSHRPDSPEPSDRCARVVRFWTSPETTKRRSMRSVEDVEAYLGQLNRQFSHVDDQPGTFLVHGGATCRRWRSASTRRSSCSACTSATRRRPDAERRALPRSSSTINAKSLVHASYGLEDDASSSRARSSSRTSTSTSSRPRSTRSTSPSRSRCQLGALRRSPRTQRLKRNS